MADTQFTVDPEQDEGFYVTVAEEVTVYEEYDDAVAEIQDKLTADADSFLAEVNIADNGDDDIAVTLEQVSWQQVIQDLSIHAADQS